MLNKTLARFLFLCTISLLFSSCALNYYYTYQPSSSGTGKAMFKPSIPTDKTYITLNDSIILDNKIVKSITFENLPEGKYELHYVSSNWAYKEKLDQRINFEIQQGKIVNQLISIPPFSTGYWVFNSILCAGLITYYLSMYSY